MHARWPRTSRSSPSATRTGFLCWSQRTRRQGPGWSCCGASAQTQMTSAAPVPGGLSPNSWTPPGHAACSANSEPQPWPPPSSPSGNNNVRQPRQRRLDQLAQDQDPAWADAERLINAKLPAHYDAAVTLLRDLQELAQREDQAQAFARRFTALREAHLRKPSLIARFDRAGLTL